MTVSSTVVDTRYAANSGTTDFATGFPFYATSSLRVSTIVTATGVETVLVLVTDYTVTGGEGATGTVTFPEAPATGLTVVIKRVEPYTQLTDLANGDSLPADVLESTYDKQEMQLQQIRMVAISAIAPPPSFNPNTTPAFTMPIPVSGQQLVGNAAGTGWDSAVVAVIPATVPVTLSGLADHDLLQYDLGGLTWRNHTPEAVRATMKQLKIVVQKFPATATYTPTAGMVYGTAEGWGGGAGGGGATAASSGGNVAPAGAGGAGGYSRLTFTATTIGASKAVVIGAAGTGGAAGNHDGTAGGDTTLGGTLLVAKGGTGGLQNVGGDFNGGFGGPGGIAGTGDIAAPGQDGDSGATYSQLVYPMGGSTLLGSGGKAPTAGAVSSNGAAATGKGAGGGGGVGVNGSTNASGGNGTPGYMIITEYVWA